jgi:TonB-dependent SusC/RagA subfamily outer membrane receptor
VGNQKNISVSLNQRVNSQDAVVVVGYGSQRKKDATGAISSVKARDLNTVNAVSIDNLLQGRAAGLNVTTSSAQPGGSLDINIRGALSPRGSNSPLYVIDGLPLTSNNSLDRTSSTGNMRGTVDRSPLTTINPNDIESIDILKDASATSIYGSAAANGVVLITTKKGKEGKTVVNYNSSYGIQSRKDYVQPLNGIQFRSAVNSYGEEFYRFSRRLAPYGNVNPSTVPAYVPFFTSQQVAEAPVGTNYVDYIMRQGRILDQNISVS